MDAVTNLPRRILNLQVVNFTIVGGIGYILNLGVYWLLCLYFGKNSTTFLGQNLFLLPFVGSSTLAILSNYMLNKWWTFRRRVERRVGAGRYFLMAYVTLLLDMLLLFLLVHFVGLHPTIAAAIAILCVFVLRYTIAKRWIWSE